LVKSSEQGVVMAPVVAQVSLGAPEKLTSEVLRRVGGAISRWLVKNEVTSAGLDLSGLDEFKLGDPISPLCEGLLLGGFRFDRHKSSPDEKPIPTLDILDNKNFPGLAESLVHAESLCEAVNLARDWAHEPPNVINPVSLAERAKVLASKYGLGCAILDDQQLAEMGANAILSVGKGSKTPSRMIVLEYPGLDTTARPVVLVGKAITFDTGGYSLKDRDGMVGMKYDKCGGLAVLGTVLAASRLKIKTPLVGIITAAENMISGESYRPNDIIKTLSGKTVEVISADAEGRMVMCDALTYAQQKYQPRALIDLATLTGGVVVALGKVRAGVMANDDALASALFDSGERTFERLWRLPLDDEYFDLIKGDDSDFKNAGAREAHPIVGGIFLKQFVSPETPWAHLDIAGSATTDKDLPYSPKGATGFGIRLLVDYLEHL